MIPQQGPQQMPQQPMPQPQGQQMAVPDVAIEHFVEMLHSTGDDTVKQLAQDQKYMTNPMYGPLINSELTRRVAVRQQAQMEQMQAQQQQQAPQAPQQGQAPQGQPQQQAPAPAPTEVQKAQQAAQTYLAAGGRVSYDLPENSGLGALPIGHTMENMAGGGIVAFADGGYADDDLVDLGAGDEYANDGYDDDILVGGTPRDPNRKLSREELEPLINEAAKKYGVPADALWRITGAESGYKPAVVNKLSGQTGGLGGVIPSTWETYGKGRDVTDPAANIDVTAQIVRDNQASLRKALKRDPTLSETYAAHWLGPGVSTALASGRMDEPMDTALQRMSSKYDEALRKKVYAQNPDIKPNMTLGDFMALTEKKMGGGAAAPSTKKAASTQPQSDDLYFAEKTQRPKSLEGVEIPTTVGGLDKMFDQIEEERKLAAEERSKMGAKQLRQNPERATELSRIMKEADAKKKYLLQHWERALKGSQPEIFQPITKPMGTFSEEPVPNKPVGLGELGINTDMPQQVSPDVASAEDAFFGATYGMGVGGPKPPAVPKQKDDILKAAKEAIPAKERKGMSDDALMAFFLKLMGGKNRRFTSNLSDAGLTALEVEKGVRKEETDKRKEAALEKLYEAQAEMYGRDPELVRTFKALGDGDVRKGARAWMQIQQGKSSGMTDVSLMKQAAAMVEKSMSSLPGKGILVKPEEKQAKIEAQFKELQRLRGQMGLDSEGVYDYGTLMGMK